MGDKLQINGSGLWYTVVGPMVVTPQQRQLRAVRERRAARAPSRRFTMLQVAADAGVYPEFLFLVNGIDDNKNGWIDEGYDGVDNNFVYEPANGGPVCRPTRSAEWEHEAWPATVIAAFGASQPYTIQRRPAPAANSREISLPTNVVIDMTTWGNPALLGHGISGAVAVSARGDQSVHGLRRHLALSQRHGGSDDDLFDSVVVWHVGCVLPFLAGGAQRRGGDAAQ